MRSKNVEFEAERERIRAAYQRYDREPAEQLKRRLDNLGNRAIEAERDRIMAAFVKRPGVLPTGDQRCLEVGCGVGTILERLIQLGADPRRMLGVDLLGERVEAARRRLPDVQFEVNEPASLPVPSGTVHLIVAFTVFSSILDPDAASALASEICRVLAPRGHVLWYDSRYGNPRNPDVRGLSRQDIGRLFPRAEIELRSLTVLPPLVRRLGPLTAAAYPVLGQIRPLRVRYLGLITPRA